MTTAQVVETSVTVTNSSFQNYTHPDDHTTQTTLFLSTFSRKFCQKFWSDNKKFTFEYFLKNTDQ